MRRNRALLASAIALVALSACGAADSEKEMAGGTPQVPTLITAEPDRSGSALPKDQRPRERLDTTAEEFQALLGPYNKCMKEQGITDEAAIGAGSDQLGIATREETERFEAANRICEPQFFPLPPWEKDPANPEARDFALGVVKCLKDKGVRYVEVAEDGIAIAFGGDRNDSRSISMGLDLAPECEREMAAKSK
ncbi:hypothetical protein E0H26_21695 [Micromonospora zingiberis]|uniref:Sensor domain-containing protein n=1 Tax=Micromonospora zingiberis TaxID=2053011 RepID=A0A4R0GDW5_9ACTN|nr:hypothetical protein [Micromonospora zingiberis]TCB94303.1 hypothetical protein E0H26_21695 [Micromonospora zingiberis]